MLFAAGMPTYGPEFDVYFGYMNQYWTSTVEAVAGAEYDALLNILQKTASPETLDYIKKRAITGAGDLVKDVSVGELKKIHDQIAELTSRGLGPREVARKLESVVSLDSRRAAAHDRYVESLYKIKPPLSEEEIEKRAKTYYDKLLKDRRETIARTEMRKATSEVKAIDAKARGARYKVWQTVGDDRVSDECQANEAQGPIAIDATFTGGVKTAPQHPNCRCTVSYLTNPALLPEWEDRAKTRAEATAAAKADDT